MLINQCVVKIPVLKTFPKRLKNGFLPCHLTEMTVSSHRDDRIISLRWVAHLSEMIRSGRFFNAYFRHFLSSVPIFAFYFESFYWQGFLLFVRYYPSQEWTQQFSLSCPKTVSICARILEGSFCSGILTFSKAFLSGRCGRCLLALLRGFPARSLSSDHRERYFSMTRQLWRTPDNGGRRQAIGDAHG